MKPLNKFIDLTLQFIPLLLTFALAAMSYWFAMRSELDLFRTSHTLDPTKSDYYLRNFSVQSHNLAENKYSIVRSKYAEHIPKGNVLHITKPELEQFETTHSMVKGKAEKGTYLLDNNEIILHNNVVVSSQTKRGQSTMHAEAIRINDNTGDLTAQGSIKFRIEAQP